MTLVVAGVDLAAGRGTTELAVLDADGELGTTPRFRASNHVAVASDEQILGAISDSTPAVIAIDAPLSLPRAVAEALRGEPATGPLGSPYTRAAERSPVWSAIGVRPFPVSFLGGLTFRAITLVPRLKAVAPDATIIEVFPTASLRCLGITAHAAGSAGAPAIKRQAKSAEAARMRVQRGLASRIEGLPDPEKRLLGADLLDALAAALTAVAFARGDCITVGDADEGQIILPRMASPTTP